MRRTRGEKFWFWGAAWSSARCLALGLLWLVTLCGGPQRAQAQAEADAMATAETPPPIVQEEAAPEPPASSPQLALASDVSSDVSSDVGSELGVLEQRVSELRRAERRQRHHRRAHGYSLLGSFVMLTGGVTGALKYSCFTFCSGTQPTHATQVSAGFVAVGLVGVILTGAALIASSASLRRTRSELRQLTLVPTASLSDGGLDVGMALQLRF